MKLSKSGIFLIIMLVIAIGLGAWVTVMTCGVLAKDPITLPDRGSAAGTPVPVQNADKPKEPDTFVISMVGDCTLASIQTGRDFDNYIDKNGTSWPFSGVVEYLSQDEFTLANLECTFSDEKLKSSSLFYFRGPSSYADILVQGSVECVTLGNNHTNDFGAKGVTDTEAALDRRCSVGGLRRIQGGHDGARTEDRHLLSGVDRPEQKQHHRRDPEAQGCRSRYSDLRTALGHGGQLQGDHKSGILRARSH